MKDEIEDIFRNNRGWAEKISLEEPDFFHRLSQIQNPEFLWIGCSDSRVPANQITGLLPGEIFVHRNVGNIVQLNDINCMTVVKFAIEELKVSNIIICGHYKCSAVKAVLDNSAEGLVKKWLEPLGLLYQKNKLEFADLSPEASHNKLCELNVKAQVNSLCRSNSVLDRWENNQALNIYGLIYDIQDGLLKDLQVSISSKDDLFEFQRTAYF